jgi:hypothetical protein
MVVEAVSIESVSTLDSLLTGKKTGNCRKPHSYRQSSPLRYAVSQWLSGKFPNIRNREFLERSGILMRNTGKPRRATSCGHSHNLHERVDSLPIAGFVQR